MISTVERLKALADESRMRIVHLLRSGYINVQEITAILELSQSTVSHHLKILIQSDLIVSKKEGTWSYYHLNSHSKDPQVQLFIERLLPDLFSHSTELSELFAEDHRKLGLFLERRRDKKRSFFDAVARDWSTVREEAGSPASSIERVAERLPDLGTLLELGCGSGALLKKILPRTGRTIGVDFSQAMLDEARTELSGFMPPLELRLGTLEHLPLGDNSADCAVAYMVFHHLSQPERVLADVFRVLNSGGELIISDLYEHNDEYMRERYGDIWLGFDPEELASWARHAGFTNLSIHDSSGDGKIFIFECTKP